VELLLAMLPVYLAGNLHCIGMCGPIALLLGRHRYRMYYLLGRFGSFSLAGALSGAVGAAINETLRVYQIPAVTGLLFGGVIVMIGLQQLLQWKPFSFSLFRGMSDRFNKQLTLLVLQDRRLPVFLFGFFTVLLPCGQTVMVFSACAMAGDLGIGLINGMAFALLTSPSLWIAMRAQGVLAPFKQHYRTIIGALALLVGSFAIYRGALDLNTPEPTCPMCRHGGKEAPVSQVQPHPSLESDGR